MTQIGRPVYMLYERAKARQINCRVGLCGLEGYYSGAPRGNACSLVLTSLVELRNQPVHAALARKTCTTQRAAQATVKWQKSPICDVGKCGVIIWVCVTRRLLNCVGFAEPFALHFCVFDSQFGSGEGYHHIRDEHTPKLQRSNNGYAYAYRGFV